MKEVLADVTETSLSDIATSSLTVNINNIEDPGLSIEAKILLLSPELQKEHLRVRTLHSFGEDTEFIANLSVKLNHDGIEEVKTHLEQFKEFMKEAGQNPDTISFVFEGCNLNIGFNASPIFPIGRILAPH